MLECKKSYLPSRYFISSSLSFTETGASLKNSFSNASLFSVFSCPLMMLTHEFQLYFQDRSAISAAAPSPSTLRFEYEGAAALQ